MSVDKRMTREQTELFSKYQAKLGQLIAIDNNGMFDIGSEANLKGWLPIITGLKVRPTDIWICSYHKSGNTWLSEIVSLIMADGVVDRVRDRPIEERVPNVYHNMDIIYKHPKNVLHWFESIPEPRIINSHLHNKSMPKMTMPITNGKLIYILRNPKDVCISYYKYHEMRKWSDIDWPDFQRVFLAGHVINGDWLSHVSDYWLTYGSNKYPNALFVAYEELATEPAAMVRTIGRFLGKQFTDKTVDTIVSHCSFDTMRDNPMANRAQLMTSGGASGANFVRKGVVGDWRRHMTDEQSTRFDERYAQPLRAIGLRVCDDMASAQLCMSTTGRIIN